MIIVDVEQGSDLWFTEKIGKPSASNFNRILTMTGKSSQRKGYLYELAAEILMNKKTNDYHNDNMAMGKEREEESRYIYELIYDDVVEVKEVGCVYANEERKYLCSPDGIVNNKYGLEMKNVLPSTQVKYLLDNKLPSAYFAQVQGSLMVTGFERWDFFSYCPGLELLRIIVNRDEKYIKQLRVELDIFCAELEDVVNKLKGEKR